ncbi:tetratricopeptide repeat protein [Actinacidiphila oryziradicis]|uniref:Tetratricopeptide repeat protein n=1 Tax=Actinacidiphila oryziradicis TaxID=2571141 RepID=A0A4U0SGC4_9ACTN|nr:hypothetical protein [Actinacidiphila oryziradicis]TKA08502.1 hypothetical protein FCI23_27735 [Actinacidiphila oryziradicis]
MDTFSRTERALAATRAARDPRLAQAVADRDYNVTEVLAGAPQMMRRYQQATDLHKTVVHAAVDARRLGIQGPLTIDLLRASARGYLTTVQPDDTWFDQALIELTSSTRRDDRATALLISLPTADHRGVLGYTVADYLLQQLARRRRSCQLTSLTWHAFVDHITDHDDRMRVADSAQRRLRYRTAEALYRTLTPGSARAAHTLAGLLVTQEKADEAFQVLRTAADAGDFFAAHRLAELLVGQEDTDEAIRVLRPAADAGDLLAANKLAELLFGQRHADEANRVLQSAASNSHAASSHPRTVCRLAELLAGQGYTDEAIQVLRPAADARHVEAARALAGLLAKQGNADALWARADAGDFSAAGELVRLLARQGNTEALRARADAGDSSAAWLLAGLLVEQGKADEAFQVLRPAADAGDLSAAVGLIELMVRQGKADEAFQVLRPAADTDDQFTIGELTEQRNIDTLRAAADAGDLYAARRLAGLLVGQGKTDEAIRALRSLADAGDLSAVIELTMLLAQQGDAATLRTLEETGEYSAAEARASRLAGQGNIDALRALADAGDSYAAYTLTDLLAMGADTYQLHEEVHAGTYGAVDHLIAFLAQNIGYERAEQLRTQGFDTDGPH